MTEPYRAIRRAVAGERPARAFVVSEPAVGRYDAAAGGVVARYPAVAYPRLLERLAVTSSTVGRVSVYLGAITPSARFTLHGDGSEASYNPPNPDYIPGGVPVLIVWSTDDTLATASATAQFRQAD